MSYLLGTVFRIGPSSGSALLLQATAKVVHRSSSSVVACRYNWSSKPITSTAAVRTPLAAATASRHVTALIIKNEPAARREMSSGSHVTLWTAERILSGVLVPLLPLALITPAAPLDYLLAFTLVLHSHWGIEAIVVDYVRPSVFGAVIPKVAVALVYGLSAMTLGGLFYFIYSDVGLGNAVRLLWKL